MDNRRESTRAQCASLGVSGTLELLVLVTDPTTIGYIRGWLDEHDRNEAAAREEAQRILSEKAVAAAQLSAETSSAAAEASKRSALWTMIAAIVAAISTLVTAAVAFAQFQGWMPK